ncbi:hypothetical protein CRE_24472 [Caenorhabditis remanei]|uniref:Uncharacterized protein n=2 Tax=Caenorhabditis remanei TaxID=31234 RepID=E3MFT4_CAERE|nr:hypothetical protein CRE_24472 [Caenorhabditis remanei]
MDPMRDLSVSDSRSDSSSSPPPTGGLTAQTLWPQNLGDSSFQFSSMMYNPITSQISSQTNSTSTTPLHPTSSNPFDFSSAQQQYLYQSAAAASYSPWAYQAAYSFPYQGMYGSTADHGGFKANAN